jgi:arylsulfatase A-like enzyme/Tfp pilus assembly protein PilF
VTRAGLIGLCLAGVVCLGCRKPPPPRNLLLVTFDTTRSDHLGCYGRRNARTPTLDGLAARGVLFEQCRTAAPITMPSHSTMMTGLYPLAHGVRDNGLFRLPESRTTLAEILKGRGYATAAATGSFVLDRRFGLSQGFDLYEDRVRREYENLWGQRASPKNTLFFDERPAEHVNAAILPWLRQNRDKPFFVWMHYWDPHQPHIPPAPYSEVFATDLYQGEISYADAALGHVLGELEAAGVADRTVVVMTADHGEGLEEHNEITHSLLCYDATLHVPLIVAGPGVAAGKRVRERVGTVDILPTVLELLGAPARTDLQGRSLVRLWQGGEGGDDRQAYYSETLAPRVGHGLGELRAWFDGPFKYIHGPRSELYDLRADPAELRNLIDQDPKTAATLRDRLGRFIERAARPSEEAATPADPENLERLAALGYVSSGKATPEDVKDVLRSDGTPPQDRVAEIDRVSAAKTLLVRRQYREAKDIAEMLLRNAPDDALYQGLAAWAEVGLGQEEAALKRLEGMAHVLQSFGNWMYPLINRVAQGGRAERALALVDKALERDSDSPLPYALRADILRQMGREDEFVAALREALRIDPLYLPARLELGVALAQRGEKEEARKELENVLRQDPLSARGHFNYGTLLSELGRWKEARLHFARAVELDVSYCRSYAALITADVHLGDKGGAAATLERLRQQCRGDETIQQAEAFLKQESEPQ